LPGRVRDLSMEGLGVYVEDANGATMPAGASVEVSITLPRLKSELRMHGRIARARSLARGTVLGICFDRCDELWRKACEPLRLFLALQ
jgi:hypothetical protein